MINYNPPEWERIGTPLPNQSRCFLKGLPYLLTLNGFLSMHRHEVELNEPGDHSDPHRKEALVSLDLS